MDMTADERLALEASARGPTGQDTHEQRLSLRAKIVLACAEGRDITSVATHLGVRRSTVEKWRGRFVEDRLGGLLDRPRRGAPRRISDAQVEEVLLRTREPTPEGARRWSRRTLARATGLSRSTVDRIWRASGQTDMGAAGPTMNPPPLPAPGGPASSFAPPTERRHPRGTLLDVQRSLGPLHTLALAHIPPPPPFVRVRPFP